MRQLWGVVATIGLGLCVVGFLSLGDLIQYFVGNRPSVIAIPLIGVGCCVFAFARTWMLITWRRRRTSHKVHEPIGVVPQAH